MRDCTHLHVRRGAVVRTLLVTIVTLAAVALCWREGVKWVVNKALQNSNNPMPEFSMPKFEAPRFDTTNLMGGGFSRR